MEWLAVAAVAAPGVDSYPERPHSSAYFSDDFEDGLGQRRRRRERALRLHPERRARVAFTIVR